MVSLVRSGLEEQRRLLDEPASLHTALDELADATARLEHLRGPGARWAQVLGDRIADLSNDVSHRYRSDMRRIGREMDETVEGLSRGADWEQVTRDAQTHVSESTAQAFGSLQRGRNDIRAEIIDTLQDEELLVGEDDAARGARTTDLSDFWAGTESLQKMENQGLVGVRSLFGVAQTYGSSQYMFSNLSTISKFGVSLGALAAGPVLAGGFVVMGGLKVFDDRKKQVTQRKQRARTQIRGFIDNVQFEVSNEITQMVRDVQRELRDEFMARITELQRTYTETAKRAKADAQRTEQEVQQQIAQLDADLRELGDIAAALSGSGAQGSAS